MAVSIQAEPAFKAGSPILLFEGHFFRGFRSYDISLDDQRFILVEDTSEPPTQINVFLNWFEKLQRLVPTN